MSVFPLSPMEPTPRRSLRWWWAGLWLPLHEDAFDEARRLVSRWAMPLSVLVHLLLFYLLIFGEFGGQNPLPSEPPHMDVELVANPPPEPPKPKPEPKPEQPKPEPQKEEPPKPEPPKPTQPQPEPPKPQLSRVPLTPPQLLPGKLAERSAAPRHAATNGANGSSRAMALATTGPKFSLDQKDEQTKAGPSGATGPEGPELSQSEQDFVLAQVMKFWHVDFHAPEARGLVLKGTFLVQADGTLASPMNKDDPWDPAAIVEDYAALAATGYSYRRQTIDGFLMALRLCQPLNLTGMHGPWPRKIVIHFTFDSL